MTRCERCGATTDTTIRIVRCPDWVPDDRWCEPCADFDHSAVAA